MITPYYITSSSISVSRRVFHLSVCMAACFASSGLALRRKSDRWPVWECVRRNAAPFPFFYIRTNILLNSIIWAAVGSGCITIFVRPKRVSGRKFICFNLIQQMYAQIPTVPPPSIHISVSRIFPFFKRSAARSADSCHSQVTKEKIQNPEGRRSLIGI